MMPPDLERPPWGEGRSRRPDPMCVMTLMTRRGRWGAGAGTVLIVGPVSQAGTRPKEGSAPLPVCLR